MLKITCTCISVSHQIVSSRFLPCLNLHVRDLLINLSKQKLNQLVEQRHLALRDRPKKAQTGLYQPFEVSIWGIFSRRFWQQQNSAQAFIIKLFWCWKSLKFFSASKTCTWQFYQISILSKVLHSYKILFFPKNILKNYTFSDF